MKKNILLVLFIVLILFSNINCDIFGTDKEEFQLIVDNLGNSRAIIVVDGCYAGRVQAEKKTLLGYYQQKKLTHLIAKSEEGLKFKETYVNTSNLEKYEWHIYTP